MCLNNDYNKNYLNFSIAARWAKPGALILHLYGLEDPSDTKYTPNSPVIIFKKKI